MGPKVSFQYRMLNEGSPHCRFIATHEDGREWGSIVEKPYENFHEFWDEDQHSSWVTRVSRAIAREEGAPEWVLQ